MLTNNFDPVAFDLIIFEIRWYSISYILGILLGWAYIKKFIIKESILILKTTFLKNYQNIVFLRVEFLFLLFITQRTSYHQLKLNKNLRS